MHTNNLVTTCSSFHNNTSLDLTKESSALVVFRFQIALSGYNHFRGNIGGGLELISAFLRAYGTITFEENTAVVGGGITMNDRCLVSSWILLMQCWCLFVRIFRVM